MEKDYFYGVIQSHLLERIPDILGLYLFGSRVSGYTNDESDYDIAYLVPYAHNYLSSYDQFIIAQDLARKLNADVDLINLRTANTVFQFEIINSADRIITVDESECIYYEALILSMYQRFQLERMDILNEIERSGKILSK